MQYKKEAVKWPPAGENMECLQLLSNSYSRKRAEKREEGRLGEGAGIGRPIENEEEEEGERKKRRGRNRKRRRRRNRRSTLWERDLSLRKCEVRGKMN